eukprot:4494003-Ditylum_brightwellii.AAC.1
MANEKEGGGRGGSRDAKKMKATDEFCIALSALVLDKYFKALETHARGDGDQLHGEVLTARFFLPITEAIAVGMVILMFLLTTAWKAIDRHYVKGGQDNTSSTSNKNHQTRKESRISTNGR